MLHKIPTLDTIQPVQKFNSGINLEGSMNEDDEDFVDSDSDEYSDNSDKIKAK